MALSKPTSGLTKSPLTVDQINQYKTLRLVVPSEAVSDIQEKLRTKTCEIFIPESSTADTIIYIFYRNESQFILNYEAMPENMPITEVDKESMIEIAHVAQDIAEIMQPFAQKGNTSVNKFQFEFRVLMHQFVAGLVVGENKENLKKMQKKYCTKKFYPNKARIDLKRVCCPKSSDQIFQMVGPKENLFDMPRGGENPRFTF